MSTDRKTLIADTAIALLAELGGRGLTHRAVDAKAGLATGSTSFYCRTRIELLSAALRRHAALDQADLAQDAAMWAGTTPTAEGFVDGLVHRLADWLSPAKRDRLVARFELFLIASREPELAAVVESLRSGFRQATQHVLERMGVADPQAVAPALVAVVDALLFGQIGRQADAFDPGSCRRLLLQVMKIGEGQTQPG